MIPDLTPDERLEDEARRIKDTPPEKNPEAVNWPDEVRTGPIIHGDKAASDDDGSTHEHREGE
jgi:hypothetical protein